MLVRLTVGSQMTAEQMFDVISDLAAWCYVYLMWDLRCNDFEQIPEDNDYIENIMLQRSQISYKELRQEIQIWNLLIPISYPAADV